MAVALAESIVARGRYSASDTWDRFLAWRETAPDIGIVTRAHSQNGGKPIAIAFVHADTDTVMAVARAQASLNHTDPAAGWGAAIQAELIRRAIMGHDPIAEIGTVLESLANDHMMKMMSPSSTDMSMMKPDASEAKAEAQKCSIR